MEDEKKIVSLLLRDEHDTKQLAQVVADIIPASGLCIELVGDVGAGKTTFTQMLVACMGSEDSVTSPTFTLQNVYASPSHTIYHFDLYRLQDEGLLPEEIKEVLSQTRVVVVIEWADVLMYSNSLSKDRLIISFASSRDSETSRKAILHMPSYIDTKAVYTRLRGRIQ